jgi:Zn-dependent protease
MANGAYQIARLFGIPIRVHVTLLIVLPLMAVQLSRAAGSPSILWGLLAATGLFASSALHELGHSLVALRKGCRVREIMLLPIGGVAQLERMPTRPADEFQVAIAGPLVSLALALLGWAGGDLLAAMGSRPASQVVSLLGGTNLMLVLFNLLPSFPMDGGRIFRAWLTPRLGRLLATNIAARIGRLMAIVFGLIGLFSLNVFLVLIAVFIYQAAGAEYRMVRIQEASRQNWQAPWMKTEAHWPEEDIVVSPPPYRRGRTSTIFVRPLRAQHDLFEDLFEKWLR